MRAKYSKEHAQIAREIRLAKKRMFKAHREGATLDRARKDFIAEVDAVIQRRSGDHPDHEPQTTAQQDPRESPIYVAPPPAGELKAMAHSEVRDLAAQMGVDITKSWSKGELIEHIGRAHEWAGQPDPDGTRRRAMALLTRDEPLTGKQRWQLEFFCLMDRFDVVAQLCERIEQNEDFDDILIAADERNLPHETIEALCSEVAGHLESEHLLAYLFLLFEHVLANGRSLIDQESAVFEIQKLMLSANATGRDQALDHLKQAALTHLRKQEAE